MFRMMSSLIQISAEHTTTGSISSQVRSLRAHPDRSIVPSLRRPTHHHPPPRDHQNQQPCQKLWAACSGSGCSWSQGTGSLPRVANQSLHRQPTAFHGVRPHRHQDLHSRHRYFTNTWGSGFHPNSMNPKWSSLDMERLCTSHEWRQWLPLPSRRKPDENTS